jgi:hypothetical protein
MAELIGNNDINMACWFRRLVNCEFKLSSSVAGDCGRLDVIRPLMSSDFGVGNPKASW